jgi:hypothetical protein
MRHRLALLAAALAIVAAVPAVAAARDGRPDEVRVSRSCGGGVGASLRLRGRDGAIRVRFEVERSRPGSWGVVLVHEHRVSGRASARIGARDRSFELERTLPDYPGTDAVTARATSSRGVVCELTAVLPDVSDDVDPGR